MSGAWKVADITREGPRRSAYKAPSIHGVLRCVRSLDERPVVKIGGKTLVHVSDGQALLDRNVRGFAQDIEAACALVKSA